MKVVIAKRWPAGWIIASLFAALTLSACDEAEETTTETVRPVRAVQLADASSFARRWFSGRARATQEVELSFRVAGSLVDLPVDVGDKVRKDDLIARIDPATFFADVKKARAQLDSAIAAAANADAQLKRQKTLVEKGFSTKASLDEFTAGANVARAAIDGQRAVLRRAELDLGYTELKAPFAGEVVRKHVENFQDVREKQPVVRLLDSSRVEMVVDLPETLISYAHGVDEVEVIFDSFPDRVIPAKIKEIGSEASETTRTYPVTVIMEQPDGVAILPGMAGKASPKDPPPVPAEIAGSGLIAPDTALFTLPDGSKTYVWVLDPEAGIVHRREVRTGNITRFGLVVLDGVAPGEWIVTAGVHGLKEGQKVRLLEQVQGEAETAR